MCCSRTGRLPGWRYRIHLPEEQRGGHGRKTAPYGFSLRLSSYFRLRTSYFRITNHLPVDRLILIRHLEGRASRDEHVRDRFDRHRHAHPGLALVAAHHVDTTRPE